MIALLDIGNTRTKWQTQQNGVNSVTSAANNQDICEIWLDAQFANIASMLIANVSKQSLTQLITQWAQKRKVRLRVVYSQKTKLGLNCAYAQPESLGVDRWLGMLGAFKLYPGKNILVVDLGTATKLDIIRHTGQHLGGWILPGIDTMYMSLLSDTTLVHAEKSFNASLAIGQSTTECVNNACWLASTGAINLALQQASAQSCPVDVLVATGGNASLIKDLLEHPVTLIDDLIFCGLRHYIGQE
jgi:type III pantothenate kinase